MNKLEKKLSSREVADMIEMQHKNLLKKIEGIEVDLTSSSSNVSSSKYWVESTYKDAKGEERKEYQITKRGCEFLAHKTTGTKGNLFTDRYMDKFNVMEEYIQEQPKILSPREQLKVQLEILEEQDKKIDGVVKTVDDLKDNMPLFNIECKELQSLVRKIGIKALGGYKSQAYNDNSLRGKVYADIQHQLKREFGVAKYEAIKRCQLRTARRLVEEYKAPTILVNEISCTNNQITFDKEAI